MARAKSSEQAKSRAKGTAVDDINRGINTLKDLMAQVEDLTREGHPYREAVLARTDLSIRESIRRIFGEKSTEYQTHKVHKLRTNSRVESAQTTTVLKKLIAQLENQKRELLGLNPLPRQVDPSTSPSGEKPTLKAVPPSQNVAQITMTPSGPSAPTAAPVTLSVAMTTNLATAAVPVSHLSVPPVNSERLSSPPAALTQSTGESVSSPCTVMGDTAFVTKTSTQPDPSAVEPLSPSVTDIHGTIPSSEDGVTSGSRPTPPPLRSVSESRDSTGAQHSSAQKRPNSPEQIASTAVTAAMAQPGESVQDQVSHITPKTERVTHTSTPHSIPSSISPETAGRDTNQHIVLSFAPVQIESESVDHSAVTSEIRHAVRPVPSSQLLPYAADAHSAVSSGSSAGDVPIRSDNPTLPIQPLEFRPDDPLQVVRRICSRFHLVTRQLRVRKDDRPSLEVEDEYDVQDLMHALLRLEFDEVRPDEWRPSYANGKTQTSYLLHREKAVIVVKKTKAGLTVRDLSEQVKVDSAAYSSRTACQTLFCFIYDPEGRIGNPRTLEAELTMVSDGYTVEVIIAPK